MLRKTANILLLTMFLFTAMGFTVTRHYCGDRLIVVSLKHVNDCCKHCNHCHNKVSHIKINDTYDSEYNSFSLINPSSFLTTLIHTYDLFSSMIVPDHVIYIDISPPSINLENCFLEVFRN